ncbi:MAG: protein kinase [Thermoanaerobaculia bacterium]|nr:MAG: protein kinase [Thermoanaerobaculia bacterium]MBZ0100835.1 protein kinase [Thermoanaerobaculia bacterium]
MAGADEATRPRPAPSGAEPEDRRLRFERLLDHLIDLDADAARRELATLAAEGRARFLRERQILAGLEHPSIARLLDGGVAPDGRPWLVLEREDGSPTSFADADRLDVEARLRLFLEVAAAVSYAHRNLVVHRDLKPANILVNHAGPTRSATRR